MGIKISADAFGDGKEDYERIMRESDKPAKKNPALVVPVSSGIQSSVASWKVLGVQYRNGIYTVELAKALLENGAKKTQAQWAEYRELAKPQGGFYTADMPLYHSIFAALAKQKDRPEAMEARDFIQKEMRAKWLMTLTRIAYQQSGKDKVTHNFGTGEAYPAEGNIVGPDRFIENGDSKALEVLVGNENIKEVNSVYDFINGTNAYIWRVNNKPSGVDERVARFVAGSDRAGVYCNWYPAFTSASLGVRISPSSKKI